MVERLCKDCMQKEYETQKDEDSDFPIFTVIGGVIGMAVSFLTGTFVLIPVALLAGVGTDVICGRCGSNKDVYQLMNSEEDEYGRLYTKMDAEGGGDDDFWDMKSETPPKLRYRYNQAEKKLISIKDNDALGKPISSQSDFDWSIIPESVGYNTPEVAGNSSHNSGDSGSNTGNSQTGLNPDMGGLAGSGAGSADMSFSLGGGE